MTEFTIRLANRPGMLAELAQLLGQAGVNIEALAAFGYGEDGQVRLIVDNADLTRRTFRNAGISLEERDVITTILPDRPGELARMTRELADGGVNIDAMYLLNTHVDGREFAVAVADGDAATRRLAG